jgi:hypothetical protein
MIGRIATIALAGAVTVFGPVGAAIAVSDASDESDRKVVVFKREDDDDDVITGFARDDDDDDGRGDDTNTKNSRTSGVKSNDGTNSRHTSVSRNRDRSRGDLTRDRTKDGPGKSKRDWSRHHTNDRSKNDTR